MKFRTLNANEIDCRIARIYENKIVLLLYKDARVDQNILDETVGAENWQREHTSIDERLYCTVKIWDSAKCQWISKQDVGTESNTEKEKGQASDSFKRACFNWGIGRELYSAPTINIFSGNYTLKPYNGKQACFDKFIVKEIDYRNGNICKLIVENVDMKKEVFRFEIKEEKQ